MEQIYLKINIDDSCEDEQSNKKSNSFILSKSFLKHLFVDYVNEVFPAPKTFQLSISNKCDIACVMCPYHSKKIKKLHNTDYFSNAQFMTLFAFKKIARYAAKWNINVRFGNIDEPFIHPKLDLFAEYAAKLGVKHMHISTNGTLISDTDVFSYQEIVNNVKKLISLRGKYLSRAKIRISTIRDILTESEIEEFIKFWKDNGADEVTIYVLSDYMKKNENSKYYLPIEEINHLQRKPCISAWNEMYFMPDGEVGVCCRSVGYLSAIKMKEISFGSIIDEDIGKIWTNKKFQLLRNSLIDNENFSYKPCEDCTLWAYFNKKEFFTKEGDFVELTPWMKKITFK